MSEPSPDEQLREYESQLRDLEVLLRDAPDDESLLALQKDLVELISITKQTIAASLTDTVAANVSSVLDNAAAEAVSEAINDSVSPGKREWSSTAADTSHSTSEHAKKKAKKSSKEFEVPKHLIVLDTDNDAEKNRKRRALKALKSKWKEQQKEVISEQKQKSWQSFQKKKKVKSNDKSIFSTSDGDAKVGVVSTGRQFTSLGERTRHKQK